MKYIVKVEPQKLQLERDVVARATIIEFSRLTEATNYNYRGRACSTFLVI